MTRPWKVIRSRIVYDHRPWLVVHEEHVELPNGTVIPGYIRTESPDFAMVFPITADGQVVLVEQWKQGARAASIDLPAGYLDAGEDPLEAARRELLEETGYASDDWHCLGSLVLNSNRSTARMHLFLARGVQRVAAQHLECTEEIAVHLVELAELRQWIAAGRIEALSSMAGILMGLNWLESWGGGSMTTPRGKA